MCYYHDYVEHFVPISSKLEFFATQNFESKLFPATMASGENRGQN